VSQKSETEAKRTPQKRQNQRDYEIPENIRSLKCRASSEIGDCPAEDYEEETRALPEELT
jgi:hypothetical protein